MIDNRTTGDAMRNDDSKTTGEAMMTGFARLTATTQHFLNTCPAVRSWTLVARGVTFPVEGDNEQVYQADLATFEFDARVEVANVPDGVEFDAGGEIGELFAEFEAQ